MKTFHLMHQLGTNVGLILTKPGQFLFLGTDRQTNTVLESSHGNTQKIQLKAQNYWLAVDPYMHPPDGKHKYM